MMSWKKWLVGLVLLTALIPIVFGVRAMLDSNANQAGSHAQGDRTLIPEVMTIDQLIDQTAQDFDISKSAAQKQLGYTETMIKDALADQTTYRVFSQPLQVKADYQPTMRLYCETTESGAFRAIEKILGINMILESAETTKQFHGYLYANLEDPNRVFCIVNGDFYHQGTTTRDTGGRGGETDAVNTDFEVSESSDHYHYQYAERYWHF